MKVKGLICFFMVFVAIFFLKAQTQEKGRLVVKFKRSHNLHPLNASLAEFFDQNVSSTRTLTSPANFSNIYFKRVFPYAGKFEERHVKFDLDLFYYIESRKNRLESPDVWKIKNELEALELFESIEIENPYSLDSKNIPDSLFSKQWSLHNSGQFGGRVGADIGLINALKIEKGKKDIIISIHDSGIDYNHPDVIKNLWVNEGEIAGNGLDDDNNGYIDDVHGFNFVKHTNDLVDRNGHGTGIAGIIAAESDSDGIIGIAGGDSDSSGVRLMICRLDADREDLDVINPHESIVYAADNGSIISSNSWGSYGRNNSVLSAMEYYASVSGNEYMNTGLIVFSAGNTASTSERYEKENPNVMSIASTDHNDKLSSFSNFGTWIDLCAPGEDIFTHDIEGGYTYLSGTSFAAPIVSAVAGLVLSKFGHSAYTLDSLRNRILESSDNIDEFNPGRVGRLGAGRLNAFEALLVEENESPEEPSNIWLQESAFFVDLNLVTPFDNTIAPFKYEVELRTENGVAERIIFSTPFPNFGDSIDFRIDSLKPSSTYSLNIKSVDYFENSSIWSDTIKFSTLGKQKIVITDFANEIELKRGEDSSVIFSFENHGDAPARWKLSEMVSSQKYGEISFKITSDFHDSVIDMITSNGGEVSILKENFLESDLLGVHVLILDDKIDKFDFEQISYLQDWVRLGGKVIMGLDSESALGNANALLEPTGIEYNLYDEIHYSYFYDLPESHLLLAGVRDLYLYFYKAFLAINSGLAEPVLYDEDGNVHIVKSEWCMGELIVVANQYFQDFQFNNLNNEVLVENSIDYLANNVTFSSNNVLSGLLKSGEKESIFLSFNQNLGPSFDGEINLVSDDYENPIITNNYHLRIKGESRSVLKSDSILFDTTYVNYPSSESFYVTNGGTDELLVEFPEQSSAFSFSKTGTVFSLAPGEKIANTISFSPDTTRFYLEDLTILCTDSARKIMISGGGLIPPKMIISKDTFKISSLESKSIIKNLLIENGKGTSPLKYKWSLLQSERSYDWAPHDTSVFESKVIGITDLKRYNSNISQHPFYDRNAILEVSTPLRKNSFDLDSLDLLVLDERLWRLSKSDAREINQWVKNGGLLLLQTDQIYDQEKLDSLLVRTNIDGIVRTSLKYDTLTSINYHPITEGVTAIWSSSSSAYIRTANDRNVLINDHDGKAFLAYDNYGEGKIIAVSHEILSSSISDTANVRLIDQCFKWFFGESEEFWISVNNSSSGILNEGESDLFEIGINMVRNGKREALIVYQTNEPDSSQSVVVQMEAVAFPNSLPELVQSTDFQVEENPNNDFLVGSLSATDSDGDPIVFGNTDNSHPSLYISIAGELVILDSAFFDFEKIERIVTEVQFTDGKDTVSSSILVEILDVNESPILYDTLISIREDVVIGSIVGEIEGMDPENDLLSYTLENNSQFSILENGSLVLDKKLDYRQTSSYRLLLTVEDGEYSDQAVLRINVSEVLSVNSLPELTSSTIYQINENPNNNYVLGFLSAIDSDGDEITFGNTQNSHPSLFTSEKGELVIVDSAYYDFEKIKEIVSEIQLTDGKDTVSTSLLVEVLNINESPMLDDTLLSISEDLVIGSIVGEIEGMDPENDVLSYTLENNSQFSILENGSLVLDKKLDYRQTSSYRLLLTVEDGEYSDQALLHINISDILSLDKNENLILYPNPTQRFLQISEDFKIGSIRDVSGKVLFQFEAKLIDLKFLDSGVYLIEIVRLDGSKKVFKLIKV